MLGQAGRGPAGFAVLARHVLRERAQLARAADLLEGELPAIAAVLTTEMAKTFASAKAETAKCAAALRFYADHAEAMLADVPVASGARQSFMRYGPMGPVLAVMPWNFPLWQVMRFAAPGLMAGNVGLLKHASNVPQTALSSRTCSAGPGTPPGPSRRCSSSRGGWTR